MHVTHLMTATHLQGVDQVWGIGTSNSSSTNCQGRCQRLRKGISHSQSNSKGVVCGHNDGPKPSGRNDRGQDLVVSLHLSGGSIIRIQPRMPLVAEEGD